MNGPPEGGDSQPYHGGFVFDRLFLPMLLGQGRLIAERFKPFNPKEEDRFQHES